MKTVVITGSTRGLGYGLADSFLALGCAVTISGRTLANVEKAVAELTAKHEAERVLGQPCDVTDLEQVQALWDAAQAHFGKVDIWINNAGIGHLQMDFWELSPDYQAAQVMVGGAVAHTATTPEPDVTLPAIHDHTRQFAYNGAVAVSSAVQYHT